MKFNISEEDSLKSGVYKITTSSKVYIGQTRNFKGRHQSHLNGMHSKKVQMNENSTFEIIEIVLDLSKLNERELYWINFYDAYNTGMNSKTPKRLQEHKNKILIKLETPLFDLLKQKAHDECRSWKATAEMIIKNSLQAD